MRLPGAIRPFLPAGVIERVGTCRWDEPTYFDRMARGPTTLYSEANMDSVRKVAPRSRFWIAALATAALGIGTWSIAYAQYPYYPYPPTYYPYYPPPAPAYPPAQSYTPQPSYAPRAGRSSGNIARQLNQQELKKLQAAPVNPPPPPYYYPPPPRY